MVPSSNALFTSTTPSTPPRVDIEQIALRHRQINLVVVANIGVVGTMALAVAVFGGSLALTGIFSLLLFVGWLAIVVTTYRLGSAIGWSKGASVAAAASTLLGLIGLAVIIVVVSRARKLMQKEGLPIGFLGVAPDALRVRRDTA